MLYTAIKAVGDNGIEKLALDLINRQKAEIEEQQSEIKILKDSNINLQELYQTEREKVKTAKQKCIDIAKVLKNAKVEALNEAASKFAGHSDYHGDTILCKLYCMAEGKEIGNAKPLDTSKIKTEAYKECLAKIEQRDVSESDFYIMVKKSEFGNLLKELVGDADDRH